MVVDNRYENHSENFFQESHNPIRILIADRYLVVSSGLRYELEKYDNISVVGITNSGREAIDLALKLKPDLLVTDIALLDLNGMQVTRRLQNQYSSPKESTRVLAFSEQCDKHHVWGMLVAGAIGYILKNEPISSLIESVKLAARGQTTLSLPIQKILIELIPALNQTLSNREKDVMSLVGQGLSNKEISKALQISESTITHYLSNIYQKLPTVRNRAEAVAWARINKIAHTAHL